MLTQQEILRKLDDLAEQFDIYFKNKQYGRAKSLYDTARNVAVFVQLQEDDMIKLFGRQDPEDPEEGKFKLAEVQKCYFEESVRYGKPDPPRPFQKTRI